MAASQRIVVPQITALVALVFAIGACSDSTSSSNGEGRVRVVNSVFQGASAATATPVAIDLLVDSSTTGAGLSSLTALAISPGEADGSGAGAIGAASGAGARFTAAGYRDVPAGTHSFVARVGGSSGSTSSFFRDPSSGTEYLPKQYVTPFPYTIILAGVVPPDGTPADPNAVPFVSIVDDPFSPPSDGSALQARFRVINAAPYTSSSGAGASINVFVTPGTTAPATLPATADGVATYRNGSAYLNEDAGEYTLTLALADGTILYQDVIELGAGDVRTYILQSTAAGAPSSGNHRVVSLLDNLF